MGIDAYLVDVETDIANGLPSFTTVGLPQGAVKEGRDGGNTYPMQARVISLPTRKQRRGNTAGDAAKVGAGGLLGGIAGRLIGGNKKGTIIGAVSGVAAGAGVAAATRNEDIVVDAGAPVLLMLIAPLML